MNVKELKEKLENVPDSLPVIMADNNLVTFIKIGKTYCAVDALIVSDADICCKCDTEIDEHECNYYDEENDEYYCEECYIQLLAKNNGLI